MNILHVIPYFTFTRGGDVNVCYNLAKQFTDMGHNVTILTSTFEYNSEDTDSIDKLTMIPIEYRLNIALFIYTPKMKNWLKENIKNYDIIHLHELRSYQNNIVVKYALKEDIPYIVMPHASTPKHVSRSFIKEAYDFFYGNNIMKNASSIIAVSDEEAYYDKKMTDKPVEVVYNGIDIEEFENLPSVGSYKDKYIHAPYILYLGRLDKLKGINHLIEAYSKLPSEFNEYKLVIAGKINEYKKELDEIIKKEDLSDKVVFTGFVKEEDKISIYQDATVFVSPVKYMGGVSLTAIESILSDTPVIVTKEAGELVEKIDAGVIVEYGNVDDIKDAIIDTIKNPEKSEKLVENGKKYVRENLTWSIVARKTMEIYESVIK